MKKETTVGTDIYSLAEYKEDEQWKRAGEIFVDVLNNKVSSPFTTRNYALFGWLADVRNYSYVDPLSFPRGLPKDFNAFDNSGSNADSFGSPDYFFYSYFYLSELLAVDYSETILELG